MGGESSRGGISYLPTELVARKVTRSELANHAKSVSALENALVLEKCHPQRQSNQQPHYPSADDV